MIFHWNRKKREQTKVTCSRLVRKIALFGTLFVNLNQIPMTALCHRFETKIICISFSIESDRTGRAGYFIYTWGVSSREKWNVTHTSGWNDRPEFTVDRFIMTILTVRLICLDWRWLYDGEWKMGQINSLDYACERERMFANFTRR